jgi:hypothetical protein
MGPDTTVSRHHDDRSHDNENDAAAPWRISRGDNGKTEPSLPPLSAALPPPPTNEYVLNVAFFSFLGFVLFQSAFALVAHSQSMLADSEAMSVDALTYLFNLGAERLKHVPLSARELALPIPQQRYQRELQQLYLELVPPAISVVILFLVTVLTLRQAMFTLTAEESIDHVDDDVSVPIMLFFSACNLTLDVVNVTCFARTNADFALLSRIQLDAFPSSDDCPRIPCGGTNRTDSIDESSRLLVPVGDCNDTNDLCDSKDQDQRVNLNMCSAYTVCWFVGCLTINLALLPCRISQRACFSRVNCSFRTTLPWTACVCRHDAQLGGLDCRRRGHGLSVHSPGTSGRRCSRGGVPRHFGESRSIDAWFVGDGDANCALATTSLFLDSVLRLKCPISRMMLADSELDINYCIEATHHC